MKPPGPGLHRGGERADALLGEALSKAIECARCAMKYAAIQKNFTGSIANPGPIGRMPGKRASSVRTLRGPGRWPEDYPHLVLGQQIRADRGL